MKKLLILVAVTLAFTIPAFSQSADAVLGTWFNQEKDAKILIYKAGSQYQGKIIWLKEPLEKDGKTPKRDAHNSAPALRSRPILNMIILSKFAYDDGAWTGGEIYDPRSGKTYSSKMQLDGNRLNIRGYVGIPMFGRTTTWTKAG